MNFAKWPILVAALVCTAPVYAQKSWVRSDVGENRVFDVVCARMGNTKGIYVARKSAGVVCTEYSGTSWGNTVIDDTNRYTSLASGVDADVLYGLRTNGYLYKMAKSLNGWSTSLVDSNRAYANIMSGKFSDGFVGLVGKNGGLYSFGYTNSNPVYRVLYEGAAFRSAHASGNAVLACPSDGGLVLMQSASNWQPEVVVSSGSYKMALFDTADSDSIYALTTQGTLTLIRKTAGVWTASAMEPNTVYNAIAVSPVEGGIVYASAKDGNIDCWWQQEGIWGATTLTSGKYGQLATDWTGRGLVYAVPSVGSVLQGTITLNQFNFLNPVKVPMQISLRDAQGTEVNNYNVDIDNTGAYSIDTDKYGAYTIYAKGMHFVGKKSPSFNIPESGSVTVPTLSLANGDADGDGAVNLFDYVVLDEHFNTPWQMADIDGSGSVNLFDYVILDIYFGAQSDK